MTFHFGTTSTKRLNTCHRDIQAIMIEALSNSHVDMTIVCGERTEEEQERAFDEGFSKAHYGQSPHNFSPSRAVDVAPYQHGQIQWDHVGLFDTIATYIREANDKLLREGIVSIELEQIGTWDRPHYEIVGWKDMD